MARRRSRPGHHQKAAHGAKHNRARKHSAAHKGHKPHHHKGRTSG